VVKTLQAIDRLTSRSSFWMLKAKSRTRTRTSPDSSSSAAAVVVAVNKWDDVDNYTRDMTKRAIARKFKFLSFARFHYISAAKAVASQAHGLGRGGLPAAMAKLRRRDSTARPDRRVAKQSRRAPALAPQAPLCASRREQPSARRGARTALNAVSTAIAVS